MPFDLWRELQGVLSNISLVSQVVPRIILAYALIPEIAW